MSVPPLMRSGTLYHLIPILAVFAFCALILKLDSDTIKKRDTGGVGASPSPIGNQKFSEDQSVSSPRTLPGGKLSINRLTIGMTLRDIERLESSIAIEDARQKGGWSWIRCRLPDAVLDVVFSSGGDHAACIVADYHSGGILLLGISPILEVDSPVSDDDLDKIREMPGIRSAVIDGSRWIVESQDDYAIVDVSKGAVQFMTLLEGAYPSQSPALKGGGT